MWLKEETAVLSSNAAEVTTHSIKILFQLVSVVLVAPTALQKPRYLKVPITAVFGISL